MKVYVVTGPKSDDALAVCESRESADSWIEVLFEQAPGFYGIHTREVLPGPPEMVRAGKMNLKQFEALSGLCSRYGIPFEPDRFFPSYGSTGFVEGPVGDKIYVGCDPEGRIHS